MKKKLIILCSISFMSFTTLVNASSVDNSKLTDFKSGDRAYASEVTGNFKELERAVNDNFTLIDAHKKNLAVHGGNGSSGGVGGDGTAGVLEIASNDWVTGIKLPSNFNFTNCVIGTTGTPANPERITVPSGTTFRCQDGFTLNANTILVVGGGFGSGVARFPASTRYQNSAGGIGAKGMRKTVVMSSLDLLPLGGAGLNSGGFLRILSNGPIKINGTIKANGGTGSFTRPMVGIGGGAGGIIVLESEVDIDIAGSIQVNGGTGQAGSSNSYGSGGGGGGIVVLVSPIITNSTNIMVKAGSAGFSGGGFESSIGLGGSACGGNGGNGYPRNSGEASPIAATAGYVLELIGQPSSLIK